MVEWLYLKSIIRLLSRLVKPTSQDKDTARREFILNIILIGSILFTFVAGVTALVLGLLFPHPANYSQFVLGIFIFFLLCYFISRSGFQKIISYVIIALYIVAITFAQIEGGATIPVALITYALIVTMSGILVNSRFAFIISTVISAITVSLLYIQKIGLIPIPTQWNVTDINFSDGVAFCVVLLFISVISWLFNREMEAALIRAQRSEKALKRQRDSLEITVEKRTRELRLAQAETVSQLYRFAEFGRSASGMFHDLSAPLTVISLNLDKMAVKTRHIRKPYAEDVKMALQKARDGANRLEGYVKAARKQIQHQEVLEYFSPIVETEQILQIFDHLAKETQVIISFDNKADFKTYGNPIKFNQLVANLISNAIDSYENTNKKNRSVKISLYKSKLQAHLTIQDEGSGISLEALPKIFRPLFTTKTHEKGTGIGLSICKDIVEKDFHGSITVESVVGYGSTFTVTFPIRRK